jgi:uncharacterized glyoxalase superfamily protein PhnB
MSGKNPVPRKKTKAASSKTNTRAASSKTKKRAEPESFRGRSLSISITATDLHRSLAWYRDVMRFTVDRQYEDGGRLTGVSLKAGSVRVFLGQDDGAKGLDRKKGEGMSMMVTTAQDIDALATGIKERGGTLVMEPTDMPWGARVFRLRDPDNFAWVVSTERNAE